MTVAAAGHASTVVPALASAVVPTSPHPTGPGRQCSRNGCTGRAVATLTYSYADSQAVIAPLAAEHLPGAYDLCRVHADALTVPVNWEVVRLPLDAPAALDPQAQPDGGVDLEALADAVRAVGLRHDDLGADASAGSGQGAGGPRIGGTPPGVASLDELRQRRLGRP